jgi:hypothetical protein
MWIQISGMKKLEKSVKPGNYKTLWIAGKSSALIHKVAPVKVIIDRYKTELNLALQALKEFQIPANLKL